MAEFKDVGCKSIHVAPAGGPRLFLARSFHKQIFLQRRPARPILAHIATENRSVTYQFWQVGIGLPSPTWCNVWFLHLWWTAPQNMSTSWSGFMTFSMADLFSIDSSLLVHHFVSPGVRRGEAEQSLEQNQSQRWSGVFIIPWYFRLDSGSGLIPLLHPQTH